ncbi:chaplin [Streptomyces sp. ISL-99]|uniref:chaplin n=1 Tax=Streptomyces sp. ISL-99 TaxID=2819193 RepID=UPI001BE503F5|nr:chaplin [Streptomyces sp. ISL-99]MBT2524237.1 chaplin [Streptomyces sp. ISL-99]
MKYMKSATFVAGSLIAVGFASPALAEATSEGKAGYARGAFSGKKVQDPMNVCGDTVNVIGLLNPAVDNVCVNK